MLEQAFVTSKTPANHNNDIGMPMTMLAMPENTEVAVLELGMNHFGEMARLTSIAKPDIAVITNIGTMHIEHLGSREGILQAKLEIFRGVPENGGVFNGDELLWNVRRRPQQRVTYFGIENHAVRAFDVNQDGDYALRRQRWRPGGCPSGEDASGRRALRQRRAGGGDGRP